MRIVEVRIVTTGRERIATGRMPVAPVKDRMPMRGASGMEIARANRRVREENCGARGGWR